MQLENQTAEEQQAIAKAYGKLLEPGKDTGANCALELLGGAKHAYSVRPLTFKTLRENSHCHYIYICSTLGNNKYQFLSCHAVLA